MKRYTGYTDRQAIVALREEGYSYQAIAQETGWGYEIVGKICRAYQERSQAALTPQRLGRPATGPLSSFGPVVKFACLRIKRQHPGWGPDIVLAELATRSWAQGMKLPSTSRIGAYFSQFGARLVKVRSHRQLPQEKSLEPALRCAHACWQMDMDEYIELPGCGLVNILNLVDYATGIKIGSFVFSGHRNGHRCRVSWLQMQSSLRRSFSQWGLPKRIRTDRDRVRNYPFPKFFTLWLVGLGIEHELIRRVTENGCVERAHQTWEGRLAGYGPFEELSNWQDLVDYELWRMNAILPSRGRHCRRRPPLLVYPEATTPLRFYSQPDELAIFDLGRFQTYLAQGKWRRKTSCSGNFFFNNQQFYLGPAYKERYVLIKYDPLLGFEVSCPPDTTTITTVDVRGLLISDITGLSVCNS